MTRAKLSRIVAGIGAAGLMLIAQSARDGYRASYRTWRQADPNLERDAATGSAALGARADAVANQAARFGADRRAFLEAAARDSEQKLASLSAPLAAGPKIGSGVSEFVSAQLVAVRRAINTFADDPDPGIQQVRSMLERENRGLAGLSAAAAERQKAATEADGALSQEEDARNKLAGINREYASDLKKSADSVALETAQWADYYRKLSDGVRGSLAAPAPTSPISPGISDGTRDDAPVNVAPSITPLPLVRYTGDWVYGPGSASHGAQPEFVDLVVRESNGHCDGRFTARFVLPAGSTGDPVLRFEFSGDFKNTRVQQFALQTSDGSPGTIDLIPGTAFNLLEINVQISGAKPGKVHAANVVLIKK